MNTARAGLLRTTALLIAVLLIGACAGPGEQPTTPTRPLATPVVVPTDEPETAAPTSAPTSAVEPTPPLEAVEPPPLASCEPTRADALGPFYVPGAPERSRVGQGHVLSGVVLSSADCAPITGAQIEFWLAGPDGQYGDDYRAALFTDATGTYRFESHFPPAYGSRPPHIHIRISADGYEPLVTQYYPADGQTEGTFDLVLIPAN